MSYKSLKLVSALFIVFMVFAADLQATGGHVSKGPKPAWVREEEPAITADTIPGSITGGYYYLLLDNQEKISEEASYWHFAIKLLNSDGVQNMSDISIDFDPNYQSLVIHEINIYRNGVKMDGLSQHEVRTIQRETSMDRFLYDGTLTSIVNLGDTREGDIIEYSYTVTGYSPVYDGSYCRSFYFEFNDPVQKIYKRLVFPSGKKIYFSNINGMFEPVVRRVGGETEYLWEMSDVKALVYDNNVPSWFDMNKHVNITTFRTWKEVAAESAMNYVVSDDELRRLGVLAEGLFSGSNPDSLILSKIRFVQDKVRYLGFESGLNAYMPEKPGAVLESRYGDCKAKSLLLCSLLTLQGVEAYPVLVNSNGIVSDSLMLPSYNIFNHCIVQIRRNDKLYYIDPTISNQGGSLESNHIPDYGYGLVLKKGTDGLERIRCDVNSVTRVSNFFKLDTIGGGATLRVLTEYSGSCADGIRSSLQATSSDEITRSYLKFYSDTYPFIRSVSPVRYNDDRLKNEIAVEENYYIDSVWVPTEQGRPTIRMTLAALVINSVLNLPASPARTMPYLITYPSNYQEDIYVDMPEEWNVKDESAEINDSSFCFSYKVSKQNKRIHLSYKYSTIRGYQPAATFASFYSRYSKISDNLVYYLNYNTAVSGTFKFSWLAAFSFLILIAVSSLFAVRLYRRYELPAIADPQMDIGSWLVLVAIGLVASTGVILYQILAGANYMDQRTWKLLVDFSFENISLLLLIIFEFIYNCVMLVFLALLQVLFYKRRNVLPRLIIIFYAASVLFLILDTMAAFILMPDSFSEVDKRKSYLEILRTMLIAGVWITYFLRSKRVKATFTRGAPCGKILVPVPVSVTETRSVRHEESV